MTPPDSKAGAKIRSPLTSGSNLGSHRVSRPRQRLDTMASGSIEHDVHRETSICQKVLFASMHVAKECFGQRMVTERCAQSCFASDSGLYTVQVTSVRWRVYMTGKFIAYYRVSADKQGASGLGLEAQGKAVNDYLNGGRWTLVAELTEVETGKNADRPKVAEALALCKVYKAKLIIAKLDGLARNVAFVSNLMEACVDDARLETRSDLLE